MIVELEQANIQGTHAAQKSMCIGIGNEEIVLDIIADRLYSDKARVVLQEYASNARDAHREAGMHHMPISVHLPGKLDPMLKIRDYGRGMSPDVVQNVFVLMGNSTKRDDNTQTGGFGIGAKCGFAYGTRTFTVVTNHEGTRYTYLCYRAGTGKFKMDPVGSEPTDEQGTEIQIPVAESDFQRMRELALVLFRDWEVRPKLNISLSWPSAPMVEASDSSWSFVHHGTRHSAEVIASVDGIPYKTPLTYASSDYQDHTLVVRFACGELSIAANREELETGAKNTELLQTRIELAKRQLREEMNNRVFKSGVPLYSQLLNDELSMLLKLGLLELPSNMKYPAPFEEMGVEHSGYHVESKWNRGNVLQGWDDGGYRSRRAVENPGVVYVFSAGSSIAAIKDHCRSQSPRGPGLAIRLTAEADLEALGRYVDLSEVIDLKVERKERVPVPTGRTRARVYRQGFCNELLDAETLSIRKYLIERDDGFDIPVDDGTTLFVSCHHYIRNHDALQLPGIRHTVFVSGPKDRVAKATAGPVTIARRTIEHIEGLRYAAKLRDTLQSILRNAQKIRRFDLHFLRLMLRRHDPSLLGLWDSTRKDVSADAVHALPDAPNPKLHHDLTALARAMYRVANVTKKNKAMDAIQGHSHHYAGDPDFDAYYDLLYTTYYKDALNAPVPNR